MYEDKILKTIDKYTSNPLLKMCEYNIPPNEIINKKPGDLVKITRNETRIEFRIPSDYNTGDRIVVKCVC